MANFLNLHVYTSLAGYSADLLNFLKVEENFKLYSSSTSAQHLAPYFDGSIAVVGHRGQVLRRAPGSGLALTHPPLYPMARPLRLELSGGVYHAQGMML